MLGIRYKSVYITGIFLVSIPNLMGYRYQVLSVRCRSVQERAREVAPNLLEDYGREFTENIPPVYVGVRSLPNILSEISSGVFAGRILG